MTTASYTVHTIDSTPAAAREALKALHARAGMIPNLAATMAESPALLNGFLALREMYAKTGFSGAEAQVNVLTANTAATRFFSMLLEGRALPGPRNVLRLMFHPDGVRRFVMNWEAVAQTLVQRVHREAVGGALDGESRALLTEVLSYPGVPASWGVPDLSAPLVPVVPVHFRYDGQSFRYFSAVTVLGTAQDITLQEMRVECFFPLDEETSAAARRSSA